MYSRLANESNDGHDGREKLSDLSYWNTFYHAVYPVAIFCWRKRIYHWRIQEQIKVRIFTDLHNYYLLFCLIFCYFRTIPCKYIKNGVSVCPFGTSCFYAHVDEQGQPIEPSKLRVYRNNEQELKIMTQVKLSDFIHHSTVIK